jgi:plastocyanin
MSVIRTHNLLTVAIKVVPVPARTPTADLIYEPAVLHAHPGDSIRWTCANGPFVIQFLRSIPLGKVHIHSKGNEIAPIPVTPGAPKGRHAYAVAVCSGDIVYIDAGCPEIIIED